MTIYYQGRFLGLSAIFFALLCSCSKPAQSLQSAAPGEQSADAQTASEQSADEPNINEPNIDKPRIDEEDPGIFISVWRTYASDKPNASSIELPLVKSGVYDFKVDWGDGTQDTITRWDAPQKRHRYEEIGGYTVRISGQIQGWSFGSAHLENEDRDSAEKTTLGATPEILEDIYAAHKISEIKAWGSLKLGNEGRYFMGAKNLNITATDRPDISETTNFESGFAGCKTLEKVPGMNDWDVSGVTNMSHLFDEATSFNQPIGQWDVSSVTDMNNMFSDAGFFNQPLEKWDVSNVTDMSDMFYSAVHFNQPLEKWDVSNVTNMNSLFTDATSFNQPLEKWDVSNVTDMGGLFSYAAAFNQPLEKWDVSNVTNMRAIFTRAAAFNQPLEKWDVSSVTDMGDMFTNATSFNQPLEKWAVSNVTAMNGMFNGAAIFNQPLGRWDVSRVTNMGGMFLRASAFDQDISTWDISRVTNMRVMLNHSGLSTVYYDMLLDAWAQLPVSKSVPVGVAGLKYSANGTVGRDTLIQKSIGWKFEGDRLE